MDRAATAGGIPWDSAPHFLLRDRDRIFGSDFTRQVKALGIQEVLGTPRTPQQRAYIERVIGTIRRECLDHVIVFNEAALQRHLKLFLEYYHGTRTTRRRVGRCSRQSRGVWQQCRRLAGCIIGTNVAPPEPRRDVAWSHSNQLLYYGFIGGAASPTWPRGSRRRNLFG
jgi:hypothetical protein